MECEGSCIVTASELEFLVQCAVAAQDAKIRARLEGPHEGAFCENMLRKHYRVWLALLRAGGAESALAAAANRAQARSTQSAVVRINWIHAGLTDQELDALIEATTILEGHRVSVRFGDAKAQPHLRDVRALPGECRMLVRHLRVHGLSKVNEVVRSMHLRRLQLH